MGKIIISNINNKIKIFPNFEVSENEIIGLADFNNSYVKFQDSTFNEDFSGDLIVKFKLYLDSSSNYYNKLLSLCYESLTNELTVFLYDSSIYAVTKWGAYFSSFSIKDYNLSNRILNCEIKKGTGNHIDYFKIDDSSISLINSPFIFGSSAGQNSSGVGIGGIGRKTGFFSSDLLGLDNATIWDIYVINPSDSSIIHFWKGYPNGDTSAGWIDYVGNLSTTEENVLSTRNIQQEDSSSSIYIKQGNKIKIG